MANKILSVEVGYSFTKVMEMDYKVKSPKIYNSFVIATPEGVLSDGVIKLDETFLDTIRRKFVERQIKTRKAIFSVASTKIATREAKIPYCKENRIADVVRANLSDYFPIDSSQYMISHSILDVEYEADATVEAEAEAANAAVNADASQAEGKKKEKKSKKKGKPVGYKLLILAAPKQLIEGYRLFAKALNLEIETIDYNGNSVYQAAKDECKEGVQLIIKADERSSLLLVLRDGAIVMNRTIPYGIDDAIGTLMSAKSLGEVYTYEKALAVARRKTCIYRSFNEKEQLLHMEEDGDVSLEVQKDKKMVTMSLSSFVNGVSRVVDYYNANHSTEPIDKMYVTGVGADFSGLSALLTFELGAKVKNLTQLAGINMEKELKEVSFGEYVACIGAAIAPLEFYPSDKNEVPATTAGGKLDMMKLCIAVAAGCVVISVIMVVMALVPYFQEQGKKEKYEKTIAELQPVYDDYLHFVKVKNDLNQVESLDKMAKNRNEELVEFISVLETNMPKTFCANDIVATEMGISMNVTVETKKEVATVLNELWQLPSFIIADTTAVTELVTEAGEVKYSFTVDMLYAPMMDEEVVAEEE